LDELSLTNSFCPGDGKAQNDFIGDFAQIFSGKVRSLHVIRIWYPKQHAAGGPPSPAYMPDHLGAGCRDGAVVDGSAMCGDRVLLEVLGSRAPLAVLADGWDWGWVRGGVDGLLRHDARTTVSAAGKAAEVRTA
jgi:hypothetical protein